MTADLLAQSMSARLLPASDVEDRRVVQTTDARQSPPGIRLPLEVLRSIAEMLVEADWVLRADTLGSSKELLSCAAVNKAFRATILPLLWRHCELSRFTSNESLRWLTRIMPANIEHVEDIIVTVHEVPEACRLLMCLRDVDFTISGARLSVVVYEGDHVTADSVLHPADPLVSALSNLRSYPRSLKIDLDALGGAEEEGYIDLGRVLVDRPRVTVLSLYDASLAGEVWGNDNTWLDTLATMPNLAALELFACHVGSDCTERVPSFATLRFARVTPLRETDSEKWLVRAILDRSRATLEGIAVAGASSTAAWTTLQEAEKLDSIVFENSYWTTEEMLTACARFQGRYLGLYLRDGTTAQALNNISSLLQSTTAAWTSLEKVVVPTGRPQLRNILSRNGIELVDGRDCPFIETLEGFTFTPLHFATYHPIDETGFWRGSRRLRDSPELED